MSVHEAIDKVMSAPPEDQLELLRIEMEARIRNIKGYGEQLKQQSQLRQSSNPSVIVDWIIEIADELNTLVQALREEE